MEKFKQNTLASLYIVRSIANQFGGKIQKSLGQNFLINQKILLRLIDLLDIHENDTIIEIGPGIGVLSYTLCEKAKKVFLIEIDKTKSTALNKVLENFNNYEVIWSDATKFDYSIIGNSENVKVIGSLPYNSAKKIIYNLFYSDLKWSRAAFILQKEVAENYTSAPPRADFLSMFSRIFSEPSFRFMISRKSFYPMPKVDSAAITFDRHSRYDGIDKHALAKFIKKGFSTPRKTIFNNLGINHSAKETLRDIKFSKTARPSELQLEDWIYLFKNFIS